MPVYRARVLTPVDPSTVQWLSDALVVVDGTGRITEVTPPDGRPVDVDLRPGVLVPGFVDAHLHFPQVRIVGAASGPLLDWLATSTFPEEARYANADHATAMAALFCRSLAAAGTTLSMVYGSVHPSAADALFRELDRTGLRAIAGPVLMDEHAPAELLLPAGPAIDALTALAERYEGHDGRLRVAVVPRFALSCSRDMLTAAGALSRARGLWATTHLSENPEECRVARERFETADYLRIYEDAGLLHDRCVLAHCIHLSDDELDRMAAAGAIVAHCPDSNAFLGSGHMPVGRIAARGIRWAAGTDVAAGRTFRIPTVLSMAHDNALAVGVRLSPAALFWHGTRGGALALGEPRVGLIEAGCDADMVLLDVPAWVDDADGALASVLFDRDAPRPRQTWVRGRTVWARDGTGSPW